MSDRILEKMRREEEIIASKTVEELKADYDECCKNVEFIQDQINKYETLIAYLEVLNERYEEKFSENCDLCDDEDEAWDEEFDEWYRSIEPRIESLEHSLATQKWYLEEEKKKRTEKQKRYIARLIVTGGRDKFQELMGWERFNAPDYEDKRIQFGGMFPDKIEARILSYGFNHNEEGDQNE